MKCRCMFDSPLSKIQSTVEVVWKSLIWQSKQCVSMKTIGSDSKSNHFQSVCPWICERTNWRSTLILKDHVWTYLAELNKDLNFWVHFKSELLVEIGFLEWYWCCLKTDTFWTIVANFDYALVQWRRNIVCQFLYISYLSQKLIKNEKIIWYCCWVHTNSQK